MGKLQADLFGLLGRQRAVTSIFETSVSTFSSKHLTAAGFTAGLIIAACSSLMLWLDQGRNEILVTVIDFLAGFPVVFARRLDMPKPIFYLLYFACWGLNGAGIARLVQRRRASNR
jgi:hypothetical protein